jgi:hypothetical protein
MKKVKIEMLLTMLIFNFCINSLVKGNNINESNDKTLKISFEKHYNDWKAYCKKIEYSSEASLRLQSEDYKALINMGVNSIPYIIDKAENDKDFVWIGWVWGEVTRVIPDPKINPWAKESISSWWRGGRQKARERTEGLYVKWKDNKAKNLHKEAESNKDSIRALGIVAMPVIIEKLKGGDIEFVEVVSDITNNKVKKNATVEECIKWWNENKENWLIPFPNKQPVANAGKDFEAESGKQVQLDGSGSSDADGDRLEFIWIQTGRPTVQLDKTDSAKPKFSAPQVKEKTVLTFELMVNDGNPIKSYHPNSQSGQSKPDIVKVTILPKQ